MIVYYIGGVIAIRVIVITAQCHAMPYWNIVRTMAEDLA